MKKHLLLCAVPLFVSLISMSCNNSDSCCSKSTEETNEKEIPSLNISIILDLSDRIIRDNITPSQMSRDTAIVAFFADWFKEQTLGPQILKSKNRIKVLFYPLPKRDEIATWAEELSVDMSNFKPVDRRKKLENMKDIFLRNLSQIYNKTLEEHNFIGCDIWDFFSNKKVDQLCIEPDARNIVIIITDGYLYQANHTLKEGHAYSYILPKTLAIPESSLIIKRKGLENLEVLMLELNPYQPTQRNKLVEVLKNWFRDMGVKKFIVAETDVPTNTKIIIRNFLKQQSQP